MPWLREIGDLCRALLDGEVVAIPTESSFGLAVRIDSPEGLRKLKAYKPDRKKPIPLVIADPSILPVYAVEIPLQARILIQRFWPGPLTLVFSATIEVPPEIHMGSATVGVRQPGYPPLLELLKHVEVPLTATSANRPGETPVTRVEDLVRVFPELYVLDVVSSTPGGPPSSVVDVRTPMLEILREGAIPKAAIYAALSEA